jgi:hydrogenase expression/formation protein HypD
MVTVVQKDCDAVHKLVEQLGDRQVKIMEICGTHTMSIARAGLRSILPERLSLISGPGCPVCVTDQSYMDQAVYLARGGKVGDMLAAMGVSGGKEFEAPVIATYGDMVRVPGRLGSLGDARSTGARIEVVYSADQAVEFAIDHPDRQVVFLGVGFETTTPGTALAVLRAKQQGLRTFSVLTAHKLLLPAMHALMAAGDVRVDAFLCPGHVSVILGYEAYDEIVRMYGRPCVVAGFDAGQVVLGVIEILRQLLDGKPRASTVYPSVSAKGNPTALKMLDDVFVPADAAWRAVGVIPRSGLVLRPELADYDASKRFDLPTLPSYEMPGCRCGDVICGRCRPFDCKLFGKRCTTRDPVGPCMVSSEGACAAAYKYELKRS